MNERPPFRLDARRFSLEAGADPEARLSALLGPAFAAYRGEFREAEAGRRPARPLHLDVDVATVCGLGCPMCPAGSAGGGRFPGFGVLMPETLYQAVLREAAGFGLPSLRLGVTGEPLLAGDMDRWAAEARGAGLLDVALITGGGLLTPETSRALIGSGLTRLMISVDAATEQTYARVRPGGDFRLLVENIEAFLAARREAGSQLPLLRLSFVVTEANRHEAGAFRERFAPAADYLAFQDYLDLTGAPGLIPAPAPEEGGPDGDPGDGDDPGDADRPEEAARLDLPDDPVVTGRPRCPDPWTRLAVHADGGLFPCCADFGRLWPMGRFPDTGLAALWNSPEAAALARRGDHRACRLCRAASGRRSGPGRGGARTAAAA